MGDVAEILEGARASFARHDWGSAREAFEAARASSPLDADDAAALAECAWWQGDIDDCLATYEEAYRLYLQGDEPRTRQAAMLSMEISFFWFLRGETAIASGWISRAQRLLDGEPECAERAHLEILEIDDAVAAGDFERAIAVARSAADLGRRYGDATLTALAQVGEGIATIKQGRVTEGLAILDEAMLPVVAGEVAPAYAGSIYCQIMGVCHELADLRRAQQWTDATTRWCEGFESAVMFIGICRIHRAQLMQTRGEWAQAEEEARRLCDELADLNMSAVAEGYYELAEVLRLRGDFDEAEAAYAEAHRRGRSPQPGLALAALAQGRVAEAHADLVGALRGAVDGLGRARFRAAQVEVAVAMGDLDLASEAVAELDEVARTYGSSGWAATADLARGHVALAAGRPEQAVTALQSAGRRWQDLGAPYRVAQARMLLGQAHRALGDDTAAERELATAAAEFERLGAAPAAANVAALRGAESVPRPGGLTAREVEVLQLVASGATNRDVAQALFLSEKTVARHLSNIFTKLGVSSRTAAAAYAFEQGIAAPPRG